MTERDNRGFRKAAWGCGLSLVGITVIVVALLRPVSNRSVGIGSLRSQDLSQMKQIGLALDLYVADNDGRLPPDTSSVVSSSRYFGSYLKDKSVIHPTVKISSEYLGNGSLASKKVDDIEKPEEVLLFFNSAPWPNDGRTVCMADGRAIKISEADFQAAVANGWRLPPKEKPP